MDTYRVWTLSILLLQMCGWAGALIQADTWTPHGSRDFFVSSNKKKWPDAQTECGNQGGILARPTTAADRDTIVSLLQDTETIWISANDMVIEGTFVWENDNSKVAPTDWLTDPACPQPDNANTNEHCVQIKKKFCGGAFISTAWYWDDFDCSKSTFFACERPTTVTTPPIVHSCGFVSAVRPRSCDAGIQQAGVCRVSGSLGGPVLSVTPVRSAPHCAALCLRDPDCRSADYHQTASTCQLLPTTASSVLQLTAVPGTFHLSSNIC